MRVRARVRENPMAIETVVPLLEMGVSESEVLGMIEAGLQEVRPDYKRYANNNTCDFHRRCRCY